MALRLRGYMCSKDSENNEENKRYTDYSAVSSSRTRPVEVVYSRGAMFML
jgi:hypothetical protein